MIITRRASTHFVYVGQQRHARGVGDECRRDGAVSLTQLFDVRQRGVGPRFAGVGGNLEQAIGDLAHRRHDDHRTTAVALARGTNDLDETPDCVGIGD